jgi:predicted AAA+ superfamily ATPase
MLAQSSSETIKYANFASSLDISEPTVKNYLEIAEGTFIWSRLRAFDKNTKKRLIKMPIGKLYHRTVTQKSTLHIQPSQALLLQNTESSRDRPNHRNTKSTYTSRN